MPRCPLCKTQYADGVDVCKIDGTSLAGGGKRTPPVPAKEEAPPRLARGRPNPCGGTNPCDK